MSATLSVLVTSTTLRQVTTLALIFFPCSESVTYFLALCVIQNTWLRPAPLLLVCVVLFQVEVEYKAALKKANMGKVAISKDPQAQSIVEGFRM